MSGRKTLSQPGPLNYLRGLALRSGPHSEGEKAPLVWTWNAPMVQLTAFHIQVEGKPGPGRPKMAWKQLAERDCSGSSRLSTLMIEICGDLCEICHACSKPAIWKGAH